MYKISLLLANHNLAVAGIDFAATDYRADRVGGDFARHRILDRVDSADYVRLNVRILEREVAALERAVDKRQLFAVAERLRTADFAVFQGQIFRVPAEILATNHRIFDRYILRVPERILCLEMRIENLGVLDILERIFALERQIMYGHIPAFKERILRLNFAVGDIQPVAAPAEFG